MQPILKYFTDLSSNQIQQFAALQDLYIEWNKKINVISRKDIDNFYVNHVLHSLSIAAQFNFSPDSNVLDIGTGGGFPGLPLAIFFPDTKFYLADSINKKLNVVNEIASTIGLTNIVTQHIRVEDLKNKKFDAIVSRAVASLKDVWNWSWPLIKNNKVKTKTASGVADYPIGLICLKGGDLGKEIAESNCRPIVTNINEIFEEEFFKEKYILYVPI